MFKPFTEHNVFFYPKMQDHLWFCKHIEPLSIFFSTTANWILVLICLERFISVCYPLKKAYLFTKRRSYICATILIGSLFAFIMTALGVTRTVQNNICTTEQRWEILVLYSRRRYRNTFTIIYEDLEDNNFCCDRLDAKSSKTAYTSKLTDQF